METPQIRISENLAEKEQNAAEIKHVIQSVVDEYLRSEAVNCSTPVPLTIETSRGPVHCTVLFFVEAKKEKISFVIDISVDNPNRKEGEARNPVGTYQIYFEREWALWQNKPSNYSTHDKSPSVAVHPDFKDLGIGRALADTCDPLVEPIIRKISQAIPMKKATIISRDNTDPGSKEAGWTSRRWQERGKVPEMSGRVYDVIDLTSPKED
ncbi:MAG: hypothetical protein ABI758_07150 [Candidatus Woesebacteria bacterium]